MASVIGRVACILVTSDDFAYATINDNGTGMPTIWVLWAGPAAVPPPTVRTRWLSLLQDARTSKADVLVGSDDAAPAAVTYIAVPAPPVP